MAGSLDLPRQSLALLVLQPTPFCNLDCTYCYLPARDDRSRMTPETVGAAVRFAAEAGLLPPVLSIVWHAGEPMVVPRPWYEEAFASASKAAPPGTRLEHHFQTNATLVDARWCDFIRMHDIHVGVSVDGPAELHDLCRRTRSGGETHARVMQGIRRLRASEIECHAICVLTRAHLEQPDAVFDFFVHEGFRELAFNIEEIDGINRKSSLTADDAQEAFVAFFERIVARYRRCGGAIAIREIDRVVESLIDPEFGKHCHTPQNRPFGIISVAHDGGLSTFSPEMLGTRDETYGSFSFGNVHTHDLAAVLADERFRRISDDVAAGIEACRSQCRYFSFCRGGAPANKLAERGRFDVTDTLFCSLTQIITTETVLRALDRDLAEAAFLPTGSRDW